LDSKKNILTGYGKPTPLQRWTSVHMEEVDDEDTNLPNGAPLNPPHLLELSDGSDDGDPPALINVDDDSEDTEEAKEESAEEELGQS
jgi:hypothetical protein